MSGIQTAQVVNATIYLNGKTLLGRAAEVKLPEITAAMKEHSALGMVGKFELPAGFEKMEGEIVWNSFYADVLKSQADIFTAYSLQCLGIVEQPGTRQGGPAGHLPDRTVQVVPLRRVQAARGRFPDHKVFLHLRQAGPRRSGHSGAGRAGEHLQGGWKGSPFQLPRQHRRLDHERSQGTAPRGRQG